MTPSPPSARLASPDLELLPVDPAYHAVFADGSALDVSQRPGSDGRRRREFAGAEQAAGYRRLRDWLTRLYRTEFDGFIAANFDSPLSLLTPQLARLAAIGGFRRWDRMVKRYITDPRLRRVFTFQSLYAGVAPHDALAVYAVIAYMDTISGVLFPRGGIRALPDALAAAAAEAGVQFRYPRRSPSSNAAASGSPPCVQTTRAHRLRRGGADHRTAANLSTVGCKPRRAPAAGSRHRRSWSTWAAGSVRRPDGASHHSVRRGMGTDLHRHHPRRATDAGPVVTGHPADGQRPERWPRTGRDLLYVLAPAPNLVAARSTGPASVMRTTPTRSSTPCKTGCCLTYATTRTCWTSSHPADWAASGDGGRHTVRASPYLRPDRAVPAGQYRARHRQRGAGWIVHSARRGRTDRADLRAAGRRPHHRASPAGTTLNLKAGLP